MKLTCGGKGEELKRARHSYPLPEGGREMKCSVPKCPQDAVTMKAGYTLCEEHNKMDEMELGELLLGLWVDEPPLASPDITD